jgi:hydroxyethylthiazole kinase-like uncharacterized protein yjeF
VSSTASAAFGRQDAARWIAVPGAGDDKYSRGVLGMLTGSARYPGAAVLGVEGAARTGLGMIRYLGPQRAADFVLARRPEIVADEGRVQAWLIGSGMAPERDGDLQRQVLAALAEGLPTVLDAGALDLVPQARGPVILTPHFGELVPVLAAAGIRADRRAVAADPERWAREAALATGVTVLLKGATTYVADPTGSRYAVQAGPPWVATAGAGDVLAGVLGALLATHAQRIAEEPAVLADLAAAAAWLHGEAGRRASAGGPLVALDIAEALPATVAALLAGRD